MKTLQALSALKPSRIPLVAEGKSPADQENPGAQQGDAIQLMGFSSHGRYRF
jgi:hypothetical protein